MKAKSIRTGFLAVIIPLVIIALLVLTIFSYNTAKGLLDDSVSSEVQGGLNAAVADIEISLQKNLKVSQALSKAVTGGYGVLGANEYAGVLTGIVGTNDETFGGGIWFEPYAFSEDTQYFSPYCMRENGSITYVDNYDLGEGVYYTDQDWYTNVTGGQSYGWSEPYFDSFAGVSMITSSVPIYNAGGKLIGVATADIDLTQIQKLVAGLTINGKGSAVLFHTNGVYVGTADSEKLLSAKIQEEDNSSLAALGAEMIAKQSGSGSYEEGGDTYYTSYAPVGDTGLIVAVTMSENEMYGPVNHMRTSMIYMCVAAIVLLVLLMVIYISKGIVSPLTALERSTRSIAEGELDVQVDCHASNEIGVIARSTSQVVDRLRKYIDYIDEISATLNNLAEGELSIELHHEYDGEFAKVKSALENITTSLKSTMDAMISTAARVSGGSNQVAATAQALAQGATEQAATVQVLADTISEISSHVEHNAANARIASSKAVETREHMTESSRQMEEMVTAMGEISTSSSKIGKIIKTIEDIAFQTNILALNAAVEAARAGAAGKGFAVVADEVRNLASRSAEASQGTANLIESSLRAVENGKRIADDTCRTLLTAAEGVNDLTETIDKISSASEDQAHSIMQVTQNVEQISVVVQTNSASAEESAAASEELSAQAGVLEDIVSKFRL